MTKRSLWKGAFSTFVLSLLLLPNPSEGARDDLVVASNARLDGWVLEGSLLVPGGRDAVRWHNRLPCADVHEAIDAYNEGRLRVPADYSGEAPDALDHFLYSKDDIAALVAALAANGQSIPASTISVCTHPQKGWTPMSGSVLSAWQDPRARTIGDPQGCEIGDVLVVSDFFWWDHETSRWISSGWVDEFRGSWSELDTVGGRPFLVWMGAVEVRCLSLFTAQNDVANVVDLIPDQTVGLNPLGDGLVNLDTWMWVDFSTPNSTVVGPLNTSINRYGRTWNLTTTAWVDRVGWDMDCENSCTYRGPLEQYATWKHETEVDFNDTPDSPAAAYWAGEGTETGTLSTYQYRTKGEYTVSVATIWRGTWEYQGIQYTYPPVVVATPRPYHVNEIVAIHTPQ